MRGPAGFLLRILALAVVGMIIVVGGLALPPAAFVAIGLIAATAACLAGGAASERNPGRRRRAASEAAAVAAGATVAVALLLAGLVVLLGGAVAVPLAAGAGAAALLLHLRRRRRSRPAAAAVPAGRIAAVRPVRTLSTGALGREWLLSSAALGALLDPGARQAIVRRREELLDELEQRDPAGFARWLAAGPLPGSDPADYLHGDAAAGRDAA